MFKQLELEIISGVMIVVIAIVFFYGVRVGENHIQVQFDAYKKQQTILVQQQAIKAKQQEIENAKRTNATAVAYEDNIRRLRAALRLHNSTRSRATVSATAVCATGVDGSGTASQGTDEGTGFYERALKTELMLESWQEWARNQKLPIQ